MAVSTLRGTLLSRATADLVEIVRVLHERMEPSDHVGVEHESANTL
jgi:plasmid stabilization system protein ParE